MVGPRQWIVVTPLDPDLVEPGRQALGQAAAVGEDDRRAVRADEVDDALLDMGPDARATLGAGRGAGEVPGRRAEIAEIRHGHDHVEIPGLGRRGLDGRHRASPGQVARHLVDRSHRGREADPLGGTLQERVEALQRQGQVCAALGAGERVDLVDDDRLDTDKGLAGRAREQQEERLRRRDEDVARRACEGPALIGRGVAGADADRDVRRGDAEAVGCVADADER